MDIMEFIKRPEVIVGIILAIIAIIVIVMVIVYFVKKRRKKRRLTDFYTGTLVGNFIDYKSRNTANKLIWNLAELEGKKISIASLLKIKQVQDHFYGADKMFLYPRNDLGIDLLHQSKGSVFIGNRSIPTDAFVTVYSGDVIYIGFEENGVELELHYKR